MALQSKYVRFTKATTTGIQTVTGVGFTGKALLLWTTYQTAVGATTAAMMSLGLTDGILQSVRFINHPGGEASTTSAQAELTDSIAYKATATSGASPTVQARGQFGAFTDDGFTIDWVTNDSDAAIFHAIILGGDIEAAFTQVKIVGTAPVDIDVTGVGFQPTAFVVMGGAADEFGAGDYSLGAPFGSMHGFGFSNAVDNVCSWTLGRGTAGAADCYRGQMTDAVSSVRLANLAGATTFMDARITAALPDGYTITRDEGSASEPVQHVLCLRGVKFALGSFTAPLTAIPKVLDVPFNPDLMVLQTIGTTASENTSDMGLSTGAWHRSSGVSGGTWIGGVDAANPSVYRRSTYEDLVIETRNASSGSAVMQATVDNSDEASVTFDFSAVSGSADAIIYMALAATEIRGSFVAGEKTTVTASRAAAFGLDGNENTFDEEGKLKVFGKFEITEEITFPDNVRQVFNPGADVAGLNAGAISGDPSAPVDGDIWYDSSAESLKARINGATKNLSPSLDATYLTADDETADLPNSRRLLAGANIGFDDTTPGERTIYASGSGGSGNETDATAFGSEPAGSPGPVTGDLDLYTDSFYIGRYSGSAWVPWGPIYAMTLPVDGDFAWVNQGGASVDATKGGVHLSAPAGTGDNLRIRIKSAPSTPYKITAAFLALRVDENFANCGLCFRQSSDGKLATASYVWASTNLIISSKFNSPTSFSADYSPTIVWHGGKFIWLRIEDNGTNRIVSVSTDGQNWLQVHSVGRTDFLTANQVGFYCNANNGVWPSAMTLLSWKET